MSSTTKQPSPDSEFKATLPLEHRRVYLGISAVNWEWEDPSVLVTVSHDVGSVFFKMTEKELASFISTLQEAAAKQKELLCARTGF